VDKRKRCGSAFDSCFYAGLVKSIDKMCTGGLVAHENIYYMDCSFWDVIHTLNSILKCKEFCKFSQNAFVKCSTAPVFSAIWWICKNLRMCLAQTL
jgi:hypothetical protein